MVGENGKWDHHSLAEIIINKSLLLSLTATSSPNCGGMGWDYLCNKRKLTREQQCPRFINQMRSNNCWCCIYCSIEYIHAVMGTHPPPPTERTVSTCGWNLHRRDTLYYCHVDSIVLLLNPSSSPVVVLGSKPYVNSSIQHGLLLAVVVMGPLLLCGERVVNISVALTTDGHGRVGSKMSGCVCVGWVIIYIYYLLFLDFRCQIWYRGRKLNFQSLRRFCQVPRKQSWYVVPGRWEQQIKCVLSSQFLF